MKIFSNQYKNRKVLVTGHTGFKGSWLSLWLTQLQAQVYGFSLPPSTQPNHWELLGLENEEGVENHYGDIRHVQRLTEVCKHFQPEIIFHLAAQPLVRPSYETPLETWGTNVIGTANLLEACRQTPSVKAIVIITSDKCYKNQEWVWGYRENDRLGGHDPYSASKAASELVVDSYRKSFFQHDNSPLLATARAGNVIGGGDWAQDRLIPDLARAVGSQTSVVIRSPTATRPWQHVLESLSGYLLLGQRLLEGENSFADAWNFGPDESDNRKVIDLLQKMQHHWPELSWKIDEGPGVHEANLLYLDSSKARKELGWHPVWNFETSLQKTALWYQGQQQNNECLSHSQLCEYIAEADNKSIKWAIS